jgi:NAD(P)-dependent dehydrogenase (short-subunit alcohol dehydrogenase family)
MSNSENDKPITLAGKVALVTGAARRVGQAIALELAANGMNLIIHHGSSPSDAQSTADAAQQLGARVLICQADLRQPAEISQMFAQAEAYFGWLDLLVNNAASFKHNALLHLPLSEWQEVLDTNLTAPFLCSQLAAQQMLRQDPAGGAIVNIIDTSALTPWPAFPHHSVAKAGLKMLTEVSALSFGPHIRVNAIAPGPVLRDAGNSPEKWAEIGATMPLKRTGHPADVARAVVFLATQPFITGTTLRVDGGDLLV